MARFGNKNAVGNSGGKPLNDRVKMAKLRGLALDRIIAIFEMPMVKMSESDYELYKQLLVKLANNVLPQLKEVTGEDGEELKIVFDSVFKNKLKGKEKDGITPAPAPSSPKPEPIQDSESGEEEREDDIGD